MQFVKRVQALTDDELCIVAEGLVLQPFALTDVAPLAQLANNRAIFEMTKHVPHPYREEDARSWIMGHERRRRNGQEVSFAIRRQPDGVLVGTCGLVLHQQANAATLGYWVGRPHWRQGIATRAAQAVLSWAVELGATSFYAEVLRRNEASKTVLLRCGFQFVSARPAVALRDATIDDVLSFMKKGGQKAR